ncbi:uncharacterized protein L969DRAFT_89128 [Mixia osmundae IAM 14324]|uniref:Cyanovirin-N domain-containing protein n=1 Tax=Mixia osmundae (strain CBS 9802 / IAM 14324 / JCM 22182 / KY 12970) TaxID=764103 RepID=G7E0Q5_MIXOS|nr:uncharacterized protein L969DRAFT_89128 [Mixia osmundae IAM 14324]KEI37891.1 hypothetical protein L969DRAFT_89128 [Mixia osmundae IAM 14324]GAA96415.1 hypothetical protein E5Q_03082 [Mixia osmundae IAM 14324]
MLAARITSATLSLCVLITGTSASVVKAKFADGRTYEIYCKSDILFGAMTVDSCNNGHNLACRGNIIIAVNDPSQAVQTCPAGAGVAVCVLSSGC